MARRERLVNNASTTLSATMTDVVTSATVTDGTVFPSEGDFRVIIGTEILLVTARSGNTLTVERGIETSVAIAHSTADVVKFILTAGALEQYAEEVTWHGESAPPLRVTNPTTDAKAVVADFTWVNQGSSVATDRGSSISLNVPQAATQNVSGLFFTAPTAPYAIIMGFKTTGAREASGQFGLSFRKNSDSKLFSIVRRLTGHIEVVQMTNSTTYSASLSPPGTTQSWSWGGGITWFKIEDDNTDLNFSTGVNGVDWTEVATQARTTFMTGGPDEIGFYANPATANNFPIVTDIYCFVKE